MTYLNIQGTCRVCGRRVIGVLADRGGSRMEGNCPRCGCFEFYVDNAMIYFEKIQEMTIAEAIEYAQSIETEDHIEGLLRLEIHTLNRAEVTKALIEQYDRLDEGTVTFGFEKAKRYTQEEVVERIQAEEPGHHHTDPRVWVHPEVFADG